MESLVPAKDSVPWQIDGPGGLAVYNKVVLYLRRQLQMTTRDMLSLSQTEWHALLSDTYRELVALGEISPSTER